MKHSFLLLLLILSSSLFSQTMNGKILDEKNQAVPFASITLHDSKDSSLIKGELSDLDGNFSFSVPNDATVFVRASYLGYQDYSSPSIPFKKGTQEITVSLSPSSTTLNEVVVVAKKPFIEVQADKLVLNPEASSTNAGANGLELLRKAPGVTIDNNENVQLKGKNSVRIYIDGKPSYLSAAELTAMLKGMTAADIDAIEIITNPSAKYDAQGNAGIINIRLKKNKNFGTNGSLNASLGYGKYHKAYTSLNLNNRNKKVNTFGSIGIGDNVYWNSLNMYRKQDGLIFDQKQEQKSKSRPLNTKVGVDYFLNSRHTFGLLANLSTVLPGAQWRSVSNTSIMTNEAQMRADSVLQATNTIKQRRASANFNFNYRYADTSGNELTLDLDKGLFRSMSSSLQPNYYRDQFDGNLLSQRVFSNNTPSDIDIYTAKVDYNKSYKSGFKWSTGAKYANVITDNIFEFFNHKESQIVKDRAQSNNFEYTERVAAAYINANGKAGKKLGYQLGLRFEHTYSFGNLMRDPSFPRLQADSVKRNYQNLFPSAAFTYTLNPNNVLNLTYSRRLNRPSYEDLNPFEWKLDELSFRKGNPFLRPSYSHNLELGYTIKQAATVSLAYSNEDDVITDIVENDPKVPNKTFINYRNLTNQSQYALNINTPLPIKKWWNGYLSFSLYKAYYKAEFPEYSFNVSTPIATNVYMEHGFTLPKGYTFDISGWYNSASIWGGSWLSEPQGSLDLGLKKNLFKDKGSIKLAVTDILGTAPWRSYSDAIPGLVIRGSGAWESQQVKLNFNYRFGNNNVKASRNRKTGLEDEKNRIKG